MRSVPVSIGERGNGKRQARIVTRLIRLDNFTRQRTGRIEIASVHRIQRGILLVEQVVRIDFEYALAPFLGALEVERVEIGNRKIVVSGAVSREFLDQGLVILDRFLEVAADGKVIGSERPEALPLGHRLLQRQRLVPGLLRLGTAAEMMRSNCPARIGTSKVRVAFQRRLVQRDCLFVIPVVGQHLGPRIIVRSLQCPSRECFDNALALIADVFVAELFPYLVGHLGHSAQDTDFVLGGSFHLCDRFAVYRFHHPYREDVLAIGFADITGKNQFDTFTHRNQSRTFFVQSASGLQPRCLPFC